MGAARSVHMPLFLWNGKADRPLRQPGYRPGRWISANQFTILLRRPILAL